MENNYLVSIIVPVFNAEKYIETCINSITNQTYTNIEILLIDDGSTDNSLSICNKFAKDDSRIKVFHQQNHGVSAARNLGLDSVTGDYIVCVDSDDFISNVYIEYLLNLCLKYNSQCAQIDYMYVEKDCNDIPLVFNMNRINEQEFNFVSMFTNSKRIYRAIVCGKIFAKELFDYYRFPVGRIYEDEEAAFKLLYKANKIITSNIKLYFYRMSDNSIMRNNKNVNFDFVVLHQGIIKMLENNNEDTLLTYEIKEFCIRLMMQYIKSKNNHDKKEDIIRLLSLFKNNYKRISGIKYFSKKERYALLLFNIFPNMFSFFENKFHIIKKSKVKRVNGN